MFLQIWRAGSKSFCEQRQIVPQADDDRSDDSNSGGSCRIIFFWAIRHFSFHLSDPSWREHMTCSWCSHESLSTSHLLYTERVRSSSSYLQTVCAHASSRGKRREEAVIKEKPHAESVNRLKHDELICLTEFLAEVMMLPRNEHVRTLTPGSPSPNSLCRLTQKQHPSISARSVYWAQ